MTVFYISSSNKLACVQFSEDAWLDCRSSLVFVANTNVSQFTAASDSRHLSVEVNIGKSEFQMFLLYEDTDNEVKVRVASRVNISSWAWQDMTAKFAQSTQKTSFTNTKLSAPFATIPFKTPRGVGPYTIFAEKYSNGSYTERALVLEWYTDLEKFEFC